MANSKSFVLFGILLCIALASANNEQKRSPPNPGERGVKFFASLGKQLPEFLFKCLSCMKKDESDISTTMMTLIGDIGKCFDDSNGSIAGTFECLLQNSVQRVLSIIGLSHKVVSCATRDMYKDTRVCVTLTTANDDICPVLIGL